MQLMRVMVNCRRFKMLLLLLLLLIGVWEYIQGTRDMVRDLEKRVKLAKCNVDSINGILAKLCQKPLYQRKDDKKDCLLNLEVNYKYLCIHFIVLSFLPCTCTL